MIKFDRLAYLQWDKLEYLDNNDDVIETFEI